jgi:hypothetical protein
VTRLLAWLESLMSQLGFVKAGEVTVEQLMREKTEKCIETTGYWSCSADLDFEIVVYETQMPIMTGAIAIYVEYEVVNDAVGVVTSIRNPATIKLIAEGDVHAVELYKWEGEGWIV